MGNTPNILSWMKTTKRISKLIYILLQAFQEIYRLLISEIITNLKYTFNIPFRITLKTIIMGTSSQFHDGAQLKFYPHLAQRYYTSTFLRLTLSKPLGLSTTPVAY